MSDMERDLGKKVAEAVNKLPEEKRLYFLGYAEGVADMTEALEKDEKAEV